MIFPAAILFDMDGTIVDNMAIHTATWLELLANHGIETTADRFFKETAGMVNPQVFRHFFGDSLTDEEIARYGAEKEILYRKRYGPVMKPVDGLVELLDTALANGVRTGIATSAPPENIDFILDGLDLRNRFEVVIGAKDITHGKPHPEIYLVCAERLGVDPKQCIVFEDAPMGIQSAVAAGMQTVVITTVLSEDEARQQNGIAATIRDFNECVAWVQKKA